LRRPLERLEARVVSLATRDPLIVHHLHGALDMAVAASLTGATGEVLWKSFVLHEAMKDPESARCSGSVGDIERRMPPLETARRE
jgi:hypothetical protein